MCFSLFLFLQIMHIFTYTQRNYTFVHFCTVYADKNSKSLQDQDYGCLSPFFLHPIIHITLSPPYKKRIHTMDVVSWAARVPAGIDFWASAKSPDRLEPAIIPAKGKWKSISKGGMFVVWHSFLNHLAHFDKMIITYFKELKPHLR